MTSTIEKYGNRNWAVKIDGVLLAVTVYKKGARAIVEFIEQMVIAKQEASESERPKIAA
jgi:hypothetical protein